MRPVFITEGLIPMTITYIDDVFAHKYRPSFVKHIIGSSKLSHFVQVSNHITPHKIRSLESDNMDHIHDFGDFGADALSVLKEKNDTLISDVHKSTLTIKQKAYTIDSLFVRLGKAIVAIKRTLDQNNNTYQDNTSTIDTSYYDENYHSFNIKLDKENILFNHLPEKFVKELLSIFDIVLELIDINAMGRLQNVLVNGHIELKTPTDLYALLQIILYEIYNFRLISISGKESKSNNNPDEIISNIRSYVTMSFLLLQSAITTYTISQSLFEGIINLPFTKEFLVYQKLNRIQYTAFNKLIHFKNILHSGHPHHDFVLESIRYMHIIFYDLTILYAVKCNSENDKKHETIKKNLKKIVKDLQALHQQTQSILPKRDVNGKHEFFDILFIKSINGDDGATILNGIFGVSNSKITDLSIFELLTLCSKDTLPINLKQNSGFGVKSKKKR